MVQMIPWAYNLQRTRYPGVGLMPDFVAGMRNHGNALQAMLLYMNDVWKDLAANDEVQYALNAKLATKTELLAAGYNSNAAKLPGYLKRGADGWRSLIRVRRRCICRSTNRLTRSCHCRRVRSLFEIRRRIEVYKFPVKPAPASNS